MYNYSITYFDGIANGFPICLQTVQKKGVLFGKYVFVINPVRASIYNMEGYERGKNMKKQKIGWFSRAMITLAGMAALCGVCFSVFSGTYVFCYALAVNGNDLGYTPSVGAYRDALDSVNTKITADFGADAALAPTPEMTVCVLPREQMPTERELYNHIASLSEHMTSCCALLVNGEEIAYFVSQDAAEQAITAYKNTFAPEGAEVRVEQKTQVAPTYAPPSAVMDAEQGLVHLIQIHPLTVFATAHEQTEQAIPFQETLTDDAALYEGQTAIDQAGAEGKKITVSVVHYKDGEELYRELISETIDPEPVTQMTRVGTKPVPTGIGSGEFLYPTSGVISSLKGERWNRQHNGIDIANNTGTDIFAADEGTVIFSGPRSTFGNLIILDHGNGYQTYYAHCSELLKQKGEIVEKGAVIAKMGSTGNSTGPHLHFEVRKDGQICNPLDYVKAPS